MVLTFPKLNWGFELVQKFIKLWKSYWLGEWCDWI